jgi:15-cis-phytoene synthase
MMMVRTASERRTVLPAEPPGDAGMEWRTARVRNRLAEAAAEASAAGLPDLELEGQLLRPLVATAMLSDAQLERMDDGFWNALLAVQMAHEASLLHDDVIDNGSTRRGRPSVAAAHGVARALVQGDHLLTAAYRLAAATGSLPFAARFACAVERTVAGEIAQGGAVGRRLDFARYREIAAGKSGELLGCALATFPTLSGRADVERCYQIGRRLGLVYQMLDDLLDYCPSAATGKPPLADYAQRRWTWVLEEVGSPEFDRDAGEIVDRLHGGPQAGDTPMRRCLARLEREAATLLEEVRTVMGPLPVLEALLEGWLQRARDAVEREAAVLASAERTRSVARAVIGSRLPTPQALAAYFARHSRSFHFAARFFPPEERARIARVYAYCRVTDDLVDQPDPAVPAEAILEEWLRLSRLAYQGESTGLGLLDEVMGEMAEHGVPFRYAAELVEGMRMDLRRERYPTLEALRGYTYRVASVVGVWVTELAGVRQGDVLERAASLGHAMQLTNILRDVGEDWRAGRLYLPADLLERHGLAEQDIAAMHEGRRPIDARYRAVLEELMEVAEQEYGRAFAAIPSLPVPFQRPVAVAARVYRGIHGEIRRIGYDNLRQRAHTSVPTKLALASLALWDLRTARSIHGAVVSPAPPGLGTLRGRASVAIGT